MAGGRHFEKYLANSLTSQHQCFKTANITILSGNVKHNAWLADIDVIAVVCCVVMWYERWLCWQLFQLRERDVRLSNLSADDLTNAATELSLAAAASRAKVTPLWVCLSAKSPLFS